MSDLQRQPRRGLRYWLARAIDAWHRSALGRALSIRCEDIALHCRSSRLKSRLKSCGEGTSFQMPVLLESPGRIDIGRDVSMAAFVHIWGVAALSSATVF